MHTCLPTPPKRGLFTWQQKTCTDAIVFIKCSSYAKLNIEQLTSQPLKLSVNSGLHKYLDWELELKKWSHESKRLKMKDIEVGVMSVSIVFRLGTKPQQCQNSMSRLFNTTDKTLIQTGRMKYFTTARKNNIKSVNLPSLVARLGNIVK